MKKPKIIVLVKNFAGINHDVELYESFKKAKKGFNEYTGFGFKRRYSNPESRKYREKFSETKIYELDMPEFLLLKREGVTYEKTRNG